MNPTSVTVKIPIAIDDRIAYHLETYIVGEESFVPGEPYQKDVVEEIRVVDSWRSHVEVEFKDWGEIWLIDNITRINYINAEHRKSIVRKRGDRKPQDPTGK